MANKRWQLRPLKRFVLLYDDQPETVEGGIIVSGRIGTHHHDFSVVAVGTNETVDFGVGDRVVVDDPNAGRRVMIDGIVYRIMPVRHVIAVAE